MVIEQGLNYVEMFMERNSKMLNDAIANLAGNHKKIIANTAEPAGYVGTVISTAGEVMKTRSVELYQQGFRQGLSGNYQLTGSNLSRFNSLPAKPYTLPISGVTNWGSRLTKGGSYIGIGSMTLESYDYFANPNTKTSGAKYSYHIGSFITSTAVGYRFGGPAGLVTGGALTTVEAGYNASKKVATEVKQGCNRFYNNMMSNFFRYK
jgi:hypothetical protein